MADAAIASESSRPTGAAPRLPVPRWELVGLVAALVALNALAIDIMLPALGQMAEAFSLENDNDRQLVVVVYLFTAGVGQLIYGPLTDSFGRRPVLIGALGGYLVGGFLCVIATDFTTLLAARAFQGFATAAARVIAVAVVRDLMSGREMAQVMSLAITVFLLVPIIAPGIGQLVLFIAPWQGVFVALLLYGIAVGVWSLSRLPETLPPERRAPFRPGPIFAAYLQIVRTPQTLGYTIASAFMFSALFSFISSSEQIMVETYGLGARFPLAFAAIAAAMSAGTILNARLVRRHGMRRLSHAALTAFIAIAGAQALLLGTGLIGFWGYLTLTCALFFSMGLTGPNFNALAMEPAGAIAGTASAAYGFATTSISAALGGAIGRLYDGTAAPIALGFFVLGFVVLGIVAITERGQLYHPGPPETPDA
jgi:DHA1 family bicyclomycin/chloramphenicol resistance-like MFS transporter